MQQPPIAPSRGTWIVALAAACGLIALFVATNARRIPHDAPLSYDESTHVFEAFEIRDLMRAGDGSGLLDVFLHKRIMKGVLYRLFFGATFALSGSAGTDVARLAMLGATAAALLVLFLLTRALARPPNADLAGALAVAFAAAAPLLSRWGRSAMVEPLNLLTILLALLLCIRDRQRPTALCAVLAALALLVAFFTKFNHGTVLFAAVGADALLVAWSRRRESWASKLRPLLPLAIAVPPLLAWFADRERLAGFWYYLVMSSPEAAEDPIRAGGTLYLEVAATRLAPWIGAGALLWLAIANGLRAHRAAREGFRLVALHFAIGMALAQLNVLKLERIMMPLSGDLFALAGLGAAAALARPLQRIPRAAPAVAALAVFAFAVAPRPSFFAIEESPLRKLDAVLDAGLDLWHRDGRALWIGAGRTDGVERLSGARVFIRAHERGMPISRGDFEYAASELFIKRGIPARLKAGTLTDAEVRKLVEGYAVVIAVHDALPNNSIIMDPVARQLVERIRKLPEFAAGTTESRRVDVAGLSTVRDATVMKVEALRRR